MLEAIKDYVRDLCVLWLNFLAIYIKSFLVSVCGHENNYYNSICPGVLLFSQPLFWRQSLYVFQSDLKLMILLLLSPEEWPSFSLF